MPSQKDTHQQPGSEGLGGKSSPENAHEVSERDLREWIAQRLDDYFDKHPYRTTEYIADFVGVSASSVSRWRRGESGVGVAHRRRLFEILQIEEQDLAKELEVPRVKLPDVRTRGAVKTRGRRPVGRAPYPSSSGVGPQAAANVLAAGQGNVACPERILAVLIEPTWPPDQADWLAEVMRNKICQLSRALEAGEKAESQPPLAWRADDLQLFKVCQKKSEVVRSFLSGVTRASSPSALILIYACGPLVTHDGQLCLMMHTDDQPLGVVSLLEQASGAASQCLLVVEGGWENAGRSLMGRQGPLQPTEAERVRDTDAALMLSSLPEREEEAKPWSFFSDGFIKGVVQGEAGGVEEAYVSARQFYRYWEATLANNNASALESRLRGEPSAIVPAPYFLSSNPEGILIPRRTN